MRVLYIGDRGVGGIAGHVKCLTESLPSDVERHVIGVGGDEAFAGKNGHDVREWFQIRRVIRTFRPDVVHFHIPNLFFALYLRIVRLFGFFNCSVVCSWHTPTDRKMGWQHRVFFWLLGKDCYYLPVSSVTWEGLKKWLPYARGEVFYNPMRIGNREEGRGKWEEGTGNWERADNYVVGMVGRNADQKDWPSFHKVEKLVKDKVSEFKGFKVFGLQGCNVEFLNAGEMEVCNGREAIEKMDLFVMTSKHEQLPTTVLECFLLGTPICGFLPVGGTKDILEFSTGPLREVFIAERDCEKLADIVMDLLAHPEKRQALVEDGRQILEGHFDAEKNVRGQLMRVYEMSGRDEWEWDNGSF